MKITTDVGEFIPGKIRRSSDQPLIRNPRISAAPPDNKRNLASASLLLSARPGERSFSDALNIAQMAQSFINRALEISSRLRNMAMSALASGKVSYEEISLAVSEMKSSMERVGNTTAIPILPTPMSRGINEEFGRETRQYLRDTVTDMERLAGEARRYQAGEKPDTASIDEIARNLESRSATLTQVIQLVGREMSGLFRGDDAGNQGSDYLRLASQASGYIRKNPVNALLAQGNINPGVISPLLQ